MFVYWYRIRVRAISLLLVIAQWTGRSNNQQKRGKNYSLLTFTSFHLICVFKYNALHNDVIHTDAEAVINM